MSQFISKTSSCFGRHLPWLAGNMNARTLAICLAALLLALVHSPPVLGQPLAMHYGSDWRKLTRAVCATKAVEAMGMQQNFIHAEIHSDGNAYGVTENAACSVHTVAQRDGVYIYVVVAGKDTNEVARLRSAI